MMLKLAKNLGVTSSLVGVIALIFGMLVSEAAKTLGVVEDTQSGWAIALLVLLVIGFVGALLARSCPGPSAVLMAIAAIASFLTRDLFFIGVGLVLIVAAGVALAGREA